MKQIRRKPQHTTDTDGQAIVLVPLANHQQPAKLFEHDFEVLMRRGLTANWTFNHNGNGHCYVRCAQDVRGKLQTVARLIKAATAGIIIRYLDGDRLNLRADNLTDRIGNSKRTATL